MYKFLRVGPVIIAGSASFQCFNGADCHIADQKQQPSNIESLPVKTSYKLPADWIQLSDSSSGHNYYFNKVTGHTQWEAPPSAKSHVKKIKSWKSNWDLRGDNTSNVTHQIVLIRHGQYVDGKHDKDRHLTDIGQKQAARTGVRLGELIDAGIVLPIDQVYYSTMTRATETFNLIAPSLAKYQLQNHQMKPCSMITEGAVCPPEPKSEQWKVTEEEFAVDGSRVRAAFKNYFHRADLTQNPTSYSTVMVCHGNVIRYLTLKSLQLPPEAWLRTAVYNASITIIEIRGNGKVSLRCFGDVGHLPAEMITYN